MTLPVDVSEADTSESDSETTLPPAKTPFYVQGDFQEEVWLCSEEYDPDTNVKDSVISVVTFHGKANFGVENFTVGSASVLCLACVNQTVWVGTIIGQVLLYDSVTHYQIFERYLSLKEEQSIVHIQHIRKLRQVREPK